MVLDFHDVCHGNTQTELTGISATAFKLLKKQGYTVIGIPYNEFNTTDKLLKRVQYLDTKLKQVVEKN